jgi:hypothetical protein
MITVIGKLADVERYRDAPGYRVFLPTNYSHAENIAWLQEAIRRGDWIQAVSETISGVYSEEYAMLENAMGVYERVGG